MCEEGSNRQQQGGMRHLAKVRHVIGYLHEGPGGTRAQPLAISPLPQPRTSMMAAECRGAIHTPVTGKCKAIPGFRPLTGMYEQMREGTEAFYIVGKYGVYVSDKICCLSRLFRWLKPLD